jgi:DNA modification methylase
MIGLYNDDCLKIMAAIPSASIDAVICDPPYELGFMGKSWDSTGIANSVEVWKQALRVLKPGGYLLAFSGTRTYHRMASAIEDAGFEVRDMIEWVYGSGFPKSLNIGKAVDKLNGGERIEVPNNRHGGGSSDLFPERNNFTTTKGTSEWEGWGTALKPAHEPICMARKPLAEKTVAENCLKWGTGGINIDESRVDYVSEYDKKHQDDIQKGQLKAENGKFFGGNGQSISSGNLQGRFPANLIHDNSEEVRECFPETKSVKVNNVKRKDCPNTAMSGRNYARFNEEEGYNDSGKASRFFKSIIYAAKASKSDRGEGNSHPTVKPVALMEYLINMITKPEWIVLDPFMGSGTTGVAAVNLNRHFVGIELDKGYFEIARKRIEEALLK